MAQHTARLDEGEEEESGVTRGEKCRAIQVEKSVNLVINGVSCGSEKSNE